MTPNELLLWLSARIEGSWVQFRTAVENLGLVDPDEAERGVIFPLYQRVRFNLERLGHVEFDTAESENGWRVTPHALAISHNSTGAIGVLCGARSPKLVAGLQLYANDVSLTSDSYPDCPDIVRATTPAVSKLVDFAARAGISCQNDAPATLLSRIPPIATLEPWFREALPASGKEWDVKHLVRVGRSATWRPITLREANEPGTEGLFCFIRFQTPQYYLRHGNQTIRLPGAVGKYWLLSNWQRHVLKYDRARMTLTVPAIFRPPLLTERALILCSGYPPTHNVAYGRSTLIYRNIPEEIAGMAGEVLKQDIR